jgi:hypothetical protein
MMQQGSVRALKSKNEAEQGESRSVSHAQEIRGKLEGGGSFTRSKPDEPASKTIAEAAAAKEEEDRMWHPSLLTRLTGL